MYSEDLPQAKFQVIDKRQPKQRKDEEYNRQARLAGKSSNGSSVDPRLRLLDRQQRQIRPASNKIDRFGRILHNKNKDISQASLDVDNDENSVNAPVQEKKQDGGRLINTDGQARQLFRHLKRRNDRNDPMQLEFGPDHIIRRLDRMKNVLQRGVVNQNALNEKLGCDFEEQKRFFMEL